jgi:hypothetical protein
MTTKRRTIRRGGTRRITPEVVAAWQAADYSALHCALGLGPWEPSPLPVEITALGCSLDDIPEQDSSSCWDDSLPKAQALQRQLLALAGWPDCRAAYEENLAEARSMAKYCAMLVKHPERRHQGTGSDDASCLHSLREARAEVRYRKRLLDELEQVQQAHKPS